MILKSLMIVSSPSPGFPLLFSSVASSISRHLFVPSLYSRSIPQVCLCSRSSSDQSAADGTTARNKSPSLLPTHTLLEDTVSCKQTSKTHTRTLKGNVQFEGF